MNDTTLARGLGRARTARRLTCAVSAAVAGLLAAAATSVAAVLPANPGNFGGVYGSAQPGDIVELAPGDYGRFTGSAKPGLVTIRAQPGVGATMSVSFSGASNLRLEGLTISSLDITGGTRNVTVAASRFTGMAVVRADQMSNANVVLDGNTHAGIDVCGNCYEGRVSVAGKGPGPSGVVIKNSVFGPGGNSDGVQVSADGVQVLNNEFLGIRQVSDVHSDALQLYGQSNTVVSGNYFHDNDVAIMAPDGGENEQITDNVFVGGGEYRPAVQLGSHDNTVFAHNTIRNIDVFLDAKSGAPPSRGSVARDNVFVNGTINSPAAKCSGCTITHNLFSRGSVGASAIVGMPVFTGGASPTTYEGHLLAPGSPGKGNASDGTDRGIRLPAGRIPAPAPTAGGGQPATAPSGNSSRVAGARLRKVPRRMTWSRLRRHGLRVRLSVQEPATVVLRLSRKGTGKALARKVRKIRAGGTRTFVLRPRNKRARAPKKAVLMVRVANQAGQASVLRRTIRITKR